MAPREEPRQNRPFVQTDERPSAHLDLDMPVSELRVRDLVTLLGGQVDTMKLPKVEKLEVSPKFELLKLEYSEVITKPLELPASPALLGGDPRLDELVLSISQLERDVANLKMKVLDQP